MAGIFSPGILGGTERAEYAPYTISQYKQTARLFRDQIEQRGLGVENLDGPTIEVLREAVLNETAKNTRTFAMFHLGRFIEHLIGTEVIAQPVPPAKEPDRPGPSA